MKLSKKSEYALLALIELARNYDSEKPVSAEHISRRYDIPKKFLETILAELKSHALVQVYRGSYGGYVLAKQPAAIHVAEIIRMVDGALAPVDSVSVNFYRSSPIEKEPKMVRVFKDIRDYTSNVLEKTSLQDLI